MKKLLVLLLVLIISASLICSCDVINRLPGIFEPDSGDETPNDPETPDEPEIPNDPETPSDPETPIDPETPDEPEIPEKPEHLYTDFTDYEKSLFLDIVGISIPFLPCDEYYAEDYAEDYDDGIYEKGVLFEVYGITEEEFLSYNELFSSYTYDGSETDETGDIWYYYTAPGEVYIDMCFFTEDGYTYANIYTYKLYEMGEGDGGDGEGDGEDTPSGDYAYTSFTEAEKKLFEGFIDSQIPFMPNNEYYLDSGYDYYYEADYLNFYTYGNTEEEFFDYMLKFDGYLLEDSFEDSEGDTWYCLERGDIYIEMAFYIYDGVKVTDVYVYYFGEDIGGGVDHLYVNFTAEEKELIYSVVGDIFPFIPNSCYVLEEYRYDYEDGSYEIGVNFYTQGNTKDEFIVYKELFSGYTFDGSETDSDGDIWYYYTTDSGVYIDLAYYTTDGINYVDLYAYFIYEDEIPEGDAQLPDNVITNQGAGLPQGNGGVFDVDFTDASPVRDVTDQGYYIDGCPTVGSPAVLVIPIDFSDSTATSKGYSIDKISTAFTGGAGSTDYYSVWEYYYISSYGKLDLDITVIDHWFRPEHPSSYYESLTQNVGYGDEMIGDQVILDEALAYLDGFMDLSKFDSDGNGIIDSVVMITTLDIDDESDFYWAYRYWNLYTDDYGYYYEYDGVSANDYMWASYAFMQEDVDEFGNITYTDKELINTFTYIHEFGHILGADDYYDTSYAGEHPLDGADIMDGSFGDHNPYTKFNYGWITSSRLVTATDSVTLTLEAFSKSGDTIIIANNWDPTLGAYQEYYVLMYYKSEGLNGEGYEYFARDGILVYHVNASLFLEEYEGEKYYDVYNTNTHHSDEYGTKDNLIEFVKSAEDSFTFVVGSTLPDVTDDFGNPLSYSFTVDAMDGDSATITFTRN